LSQIRHDCHKIVARDRKVMVVDKNSNQSQALNLVCLHMCYCFIFHYL